MIIMNARRSGIFSQFILLLLNLATCSRRIHGRNIDMISQGRLFFFPPDTSTAAPATSSAPSATSTDWTSATRAAGRGVAAAAALARGRHDGLRAPAAARGAPARTPRRPPAVQAGAGPPTALPGASAAAAPAPRHGAPRRDAAARSPSPQALRMPSLRRWSAGASGSSPRRSRPP